MNLSYYVTEGQLHVLVDMLEARIDAVLPAFGLRRVGDARIGVNQIPTEFAEELVLRIPVRQREAA